MNEREKEYKWTMEERNIWNVLGFKIKTFYECSQCFTLHSFVSSLLGLLSLSSSLFTSFVDWGSCELDVLFRRNSNQVTGNVDKLLAYCDVSLSDQNSGVMNWVGNLSLEDQGLESSLQHLGEGKTQDVIQLSFRFFE